MPRVGSGQERLGVLTKVQSRSQVGVPLSAYLGIWPVGTPSKREGDLGMNGWVAGWTEGWTDGWTGERRKKHRKLDRRKGREHPPAERLPSTRHVFYNHYLMSPRQDPVSELSGSLSQVRG